MSKVAEGALSSSEPKGKPGPDSTALSGHVRGMKFMQRAKEAGNITGAAGGPSNDKDSVGGGRWRVAGADLLRAAVGGAGMPKRKKNKNKKIKVKAGADDGNRFDALASETTHAPQAPAVERAIANDSSRPSPASIPVGLGRRSFGGFDRTVEKVVRQTDRRIRRAAKNGSSLAAAVTEAEVVAIGHVAARAKAFGFGTGRRGDGDGDEGEEAGGDNDSSDSNDSNDNDDDNDDDDDDKRDKRKNKGSGSNSKRKRDHHQGAEKDKKKKGKGKKRAKR